MASPLSVNCPGCGATLKINNPQAVGKRIRCPLCTERFVVPAASSDSSSNAAPERSASPAVAKHRTAAAASPSDFPVARPKPAPVPESDDEFRSMGEFESFDKETDAYEKNVPTPLTLSRKKSAQNRTARTPPRTSSRKPPRDAGSKPETHENSGKSANWFLIGGGVVVGLSLLIGVIFVAISAASKVSEFAEKRKASLNLAYLPKYTVFLVTVRVAELWGSPFLKSLSADPEFTDAFAKVTERIGMTPEDLDTVTYASGSPPQMMGHERVRRMQALKAASSMGSSHGQMLTVVILRAKKPFDIEKIAKAFGTAGRVKHETEKVDMLLIDQLPYFRGEERSAAAFPDAYTMIIGNQTSVESVVADKGASPDCPELDVIDGRKHFVMAFLPKNIPPATSTSLGPFQLGGGGAFQLASVMKDVRTELKVLAGSIQFTDGAEFRGVGELYSAKSAESFYQMVQRSLEPQEDFGLDSPEEEMPAEAEGNNKPEGDAKQDDSAITEADKDRKSESDDMESRESPIAKEYKERMAKLKERQKKIQQSTKVELTNERTRIEVTTVLPADVLAEYRDSWLSYLAIIDPEGAADKMERRMLAALPDEGAAGNEIGRKDGTPAESSAPTPDAASSSGTDNTVPGSNDGGTPPENAAQSYKDPDTIANVLRGRGADVRQQPDGGYSININSPRFSDADLLPVMALRGLSMVYVRDSSITDRGMRTIASNAETLKELHLLGTKITDKGLALLDPEKFKVIEVVNLCNVNNDKVTNACVPYLAKLKTLKLLLIRDTQIRGEGLETLKTELPNCKILAAQPQGR